MSLARGRFGIEYNPRRLEPESSGLGWLIVAIALAAFVSLTWTLVKRVRAKRAEVEMVAAAVESPVPVDAEPPSVPSAATTQAFRAFQPLDASLAHRPPKVRNLLMRLEEAERRKDVEMAVTTIETIRALPGSPAADLDDSLARRLGALNIRRLFDLRNAQWVKTVMVGRGDSASRIAAENGSTLASFALLNGGNVDRVVLGRKMYVLNHPRFGLVIHRRTRTADLSLNGKFFKRYDLQGDVNARSGAYEIPAQQRRLFWSGIGSAFKPADRTELDQLLPSGAPVLVSEM